MLVSNIETKNSVDYFFDTNKMQFKLYKPYLIAMMVISLFIFIVSLSSLYAQRVISCGAFQTCTIPIPFLIPITASIGLFIGTFVYYLMVKQLRKKETNLGKCSKLIYNIFSEDEKNILKEIAQQKSITQAKISSITGLPRLKVFRIIEKLKKKGFIEKQEKGKARIIKIKDEIKGFLNEEKHT